MTFKSRTAFKSYSIRDTPIATPIKFQGVLPGRGGARKISISGPLFIY
jgi:hypothetical protein